jgi:hypothetical protein
MKRLLARAMSIALIAWLGVSGLRAQGPKIIPGTINEVEEQFRVAKLSNDVQTLDRLLADVFVETDQNGNSRTKAQMIEFFRTFQIQSLTTDSFMIRVNLDTAVVTGSQTEVNAAGTDRMLYTRVWINGGDRWRLVASSQFRDPKRSAVIPR